MDIGKNLIELRKSIPDPVKLIAVSKTKGPDIVLEAYNTGHRVFGENRVQEMVEKQSLLPGDIEWHYIGHLQTNKVKYLAPFVSMIHAVDSFKLLAEIDKQAAKNKRIIPCLLQIHIAEEDTKFGLSEGELMELMDNENTQNLEFVRISGLMAMATYTDDESQIRREFHILSQLFDRVWKEKINIYPNFKELSIGMSGDYQIAIDEGSTMVRIGSLIFGSRH